MFNSLTPGRFGWKFTKVILKLTLIIDDCSISCKIALRGMSLDRTDDNATLAQVMAWCRQATSHYLSQCWPRSLLPCGITSPQWVNTLILFHLFIAICYCQKLISVHNTSQCVQHMEFPYCTLIQGVPVFLCLAKQVSWEHIINTSVVENPKKVIYCIMCQRPLPPTSCPVTGSIKPITWLFKWIQPQRFLSCL